MNPSTMEEWTPTCGSLRNWVRLENWTANREEINLHPVQIIMGEKMTKKDL